MGRGRRPDGFIDTALLERSVTKYQCRRPGIGLRSVNAGSTNAGAFFNLRIPGVVPASIDLRTTTAVADYYIRFDYQAPAGQG